MRKKNFKYTNCQKEIVSYPCKGCGHMPESHEESQHCPHCAAPLPGEAVVCPNCDYQVEGKYRTRPL